MEPNFLWLHESQPYIQLFVEAKNRNKIASERKWKTHKKLNFGCENEYISFAIFLFSILLTIKALEVGLPVERSTYHLVQSANVGQIKRLQIKHHLTIQLTKPNATRESLKPASWIAEWVWINTNTSKKTTLLLFTFFRTIRNKRSSHIRPLGWNRRRIVKAQNGVRGKAQSCRQVGKIILPRSIC